jgi:hypothetical protein
MTNLRRGEIEAEIGGERFTLCLTLGALAELESGFGVNDLVALAERFEARRLSARDVLRIIGCGLRGGGHALNDEDVGNMKVTGGLAAYVKIAADLLAATFGEDQPLQADAANPPSPRDAPM